MTDSVRIEVISDLDARWREIEPMLQALHAHHETLVRRRLLSDWSDRHRGLMEAGLASGDARILLARLDGRVVGFANAAIRRDPGVMEETFGAIDNVFVVPDMRGTGVARRLVGRLEDWFRERGVNEAQLSVVAANTHAVDVWSALGFAPLAYRMQKRLD